MQTSDNTTYTLHAHSVDAPTSVYFELDFQFIQDLFEIFRFSDSKTSPTQRNTQHQKVIKSLSLHVFQGLHSNSPVVFRFVKAPILLCYLLFIFALVFLTSFSSIFSSSLCHFKAWQPFNPIYCLENLPRSSGTVSWQVSITRLNLVSVVRNPTPEEVAPKKVTKQL